MFLVQWTYCIETAFQVRNELYDHFACYPYYCVICIARNWFDVFLVYAPSKMMMFNFT